MPRYRIARWAVDEPDHKYPLVKYQSFNSSYNEAVHRCIKTAHSNARVGQYGLYVVLNEMEERVYTYTVDPNNYWQLVGDKMDFDSHVNKALEHIQAAAQQTGNLDTLVSLQHASFNLKRMQNADKETREKMKKSRDLITNYLNGEGL